MITFYLEPQKELKLLQYLKHKDIIDHGASRMLFKADKRVKEILELSDDIRCIIKVAIGLGGMKQNNAEAETYLRYMDSDHFARIYSIGRYVIIMEEVEPDDFRTLADYIGSDWEEDFDYFCDDYNMNEDDDNYNSYYAAAELIGFLADINGCTSDNGQIGVRADGKYVAYDYGYETSSSVDSQTSSICDYMEDEDYREEYIDGLIKILCEEKDLILAVDEMDDSLGNLENDIKHTIIKDVNLRWGEENDA